jgi:hypothetical protein
MGRISLTPYKIPRNPYERELACIDPAMFTPIPPALQPLMPILKRILRQTAPKEEPEKTAPIKCDPLQDPRALLNLFYPGSFPDPLRLPIEEESVPKKRNPAPEPNPLPESLDLAGMEKRIVALEKRKSDTKSPFLKRKEAIELLKTRSTLERCERAGWLKASARQPRFVLYLREQVLACVWRISQGEFPES